MVVVAIMGLILSMGIPSIAKFLNPHGFAKTVNDVVDTCTAARQQAILNQVKTEVVFHPLERSYELAGGKAIQMGDDVNIEMLDVNLRPCKDDEIARVRFFPNGTCDEMTLILRSSKAEYRKISLEITTGQATVESDPNKWR